MNQQTFKSRADDDDAVSSSTAPLAQDAGDSLASYLSNINKLRDIYIDSSVFRNPTWEVFLSLYTKRRERLQVTLTSLCNGNRLSQADCAEAVDSLANAGLVRLDNNPIGDGPQVIDLTNQGQQRMAAFLGSAERTRS